MPNKYMNTVAVALLAVSSGVLTHAQSVKTTITLPNLPEQLATDAVHNRIYAAVPNFGSESFDYLTVIDGHSDKVLRNIQIPPIAYAVAVNPFTDRIYVGGTYVDNNGVDQSEVVEICGNEGKVNRTIHISSTTGDGILGLAVNLFTDELYVSNGSDDEIDVVRSGVVSKRISLPGEPFGVAVNPLTSQIYAALQNGNVSVINAKTKAITATTAIGASNAGIAVDLKNGDVYTTNLVFAESSTVGVLSGTGAVVTNVSVGNSPIGIDVDPLTGLVFVANSQDGTVNVIQASTNIVSSTLPVSGLFLTANFASEKVYVGSISSPSVTVISEK